MRQNKCLHTKLYPGRERHWYCDAPYPVWIAVYEYAMDEYLDDFNDITEFCKYKNDCPQYTKEFKK